jgi:chitin disaccharide deacetylase
MGTGECGRIPYLVVNADDLGLSPGINRAVIDCHTKGILTSASLLANTAGFEDAVSRCARCEGLGVGVHLNILRGQPVSQPARVASLLGSDGGFLNDLPRLWARFALGRVDCQHLKCEVREQIRKTVDRGVRVTHLDTEKHSHLLLPGYAAVVLEAARYFGIRVVRRVNERGGVGSLTHFQGWKGLVVRLRSHRTFRPSQVRPFRVADRTFGLSEAPLDVPGLIGILRRVAPGVSELMCHPGYGSGEELPSGIGGLYVSRYWDQERVALQSDRVKDEVHRLGIQLTHYGRLA